MHKPGEREFTSGYVYISVRGVINLTVRDGALTTLQETCRQIHAELNLDISERLRKRLKM
jgi:hypothetical protein